MKGHNIIRFFNLDENLRENSVTETCTRLSNLNSITCNFKKLGLLVLFIAKKKYNFVILSEKFNKTWNWIDHCKYLIYVINVFNCTMFVIENFRSIGGEKNVLIVLNKSNVDLC